MNKVFISCERIDADYPQKLIAFLEAEGIVVSTSPKNPLDATDVKWDSWYDHKLIMELAGVEVFVSVVTDSWDSSTWMAQESDVAEGLLLRGSIKKMYYIDLRSTKKVAAGMKRYLKNELSSDFQIAVSEISKLSDQTGETNRDQVFRVNVLQEFIYANADNLVVDIYYAEEGHPKRLHDAVGGTKASELLIEQLEKYLESTCRPYRMWRATGYGFAIPHLSSNCGAFLLKIEGIEHNILKKTVAFTSTK